MPSWFTISNILLFLSVLYNVSSFSALRKVKKQCSLQDYLIANFHSELALAAVYTLALLLTLIK